MEKLTKLYNSCQKFCPKRSGLPGRHPGESRGPVPRFAGLKCLDSGVRRNDGMWPPQIGQDFWQLLYRTGEVEVRGLEMIDPCVDLREFLSIMGPSESGKSALINILGCLAHRPQDFPAGR